MNEPHDTRDVPERDATGTQALLAALNDEYQTLKELSAAARLSEKELPDLLEKLRRSLSHRGQRLESLPALCQSCGFKFDERKTAKRPSRCPNCKSERISPPRFRLSG